MENISKENIDPNFAIAKFARRADRLNPTELNLARRGNPGEISIAKFGIEREFEGKTVEDAVDKAMSCLKVARNHLKIKILSEEQKGLFGMEGAKQAKIRASLVHPKPAKKKA